MTGFIGDGTASITTTGTAAKQWDISLDAGSNDLELKSEAVTKVTEINALASPAAGDVVFNTTLNLVCVYNGSGWRKLNDAAM